MGGGGEVPGDGVGRGGGDEGRRWSGCTEYSTEYRTPDWYGRTYGCRHLDALHDRAHATGHMPKALRCPTSVHVLHSCARRRGKSPIDGNDNDDNDDDVP
jgi:hypothetical protein